MSFLDRLRSLFRRPAPSPPPTPTPPAAPPTVGDVAVLQDGVNALRLARGLRPLNWDEALAPVAWRHVNAMHDAGRLAHEGVGDGSPVDRLQAAGIRWVAEGEVIAQAPDAAGAILLWKHSPPHYAILTGDFVRMGGSGMPGYWCVIVVR